MAVVNSKSLAFKLGLTSRDVYSAVLALLIRVCVSRPFELFRRLICSRRSDKQVISLVGRNACGGFGAVVSA